MDSIMFSISLIFGLGGTILSTIMFLVSPQEHEKTFAKIAFPISLFLLLISIISYLELDRIPKIEKGQVQIVNNTAISKDFDNLNRCSGLDFEEGETYYKVTMKPEWSCGLYWFSREPKFYKELPQELKEIK